MTKGVIPGHRSEIEVRAVDDAARETRRINDLEADLDGNLGARRGSGGGHVVAVTEVRYPVDENPVGEASA